MIVSEQESQDTREQEVEIQDLPTAEDESEEVKAGAVSHGVTVLAWARVDG